jgi:hypothetical protein
MKILISTDVTATLDSGTTAKHPETWVEGIERKIEEKKQLCHCV